MRKSKRAGKALIASEAKKALARLAGAGAYALPAGVAERWDVFVPHRGAVHPVLQVSRLAIERCLGKGWLARKQGHERLRLATAGVRVLRADKAAAQRARAGKGEPGPAKAAAEARDAGALAWLRRRKATGGRPPVTEVQYNAAERLAADFWNAQLMPRTTASWSSLAPSQRARRPTPGAGVELSDWVVAARQRFSRAMEAVGPELAGILVDVCCFDQRLEEAGQAAGWPERAARVVLDLALTRLARHYGMIPPERPIASRLRHWGDADYRPTLEEWR
jgi:hypothetical protein